MAKCAYCGTIILFGGKRDGELRFCGEKCWVQGLPLRRMQQVAGCFSDDAIQEHVALVHQGDCPLCHGPGPVDVHVSHRVWSGPKVIRLSDRRLVCCRSCAVKARLRDTAFSLWRGWRGIPRVPWLPLLQALRNLGGLLSLPHPAYPSDALVRLVRTNLASEFLLERNRENMSQLPAIRA